MEPVLIKLKEGSKPYQGRYYNILKAYEQPIRKEIDRIVAIDVLKKLPYNNLSVGVSDVHPAQKDWRYLYPH